MQKIKQLISRFCKKIKEKFMKLSKKKRKIVLIVAIVLVIFCIIFITKGIQRIIELQEIRKAEGSNLIEYDIKDEIEEEKYKILVRFNSVDGFEQIGYTSNKDGSEITLNCNGKHIVGLDYEGEDRKDYEFKIKEVGKEERTETMHFEIPRIEGTYSLNDGIYVNEPELEGYVKENTRYVYLDNEGNLIPGNWITDEKPNDWYSYKNQKWANIYVESKGLESAYVWIPRYVYREDDENSVSGNERMDVKFVNTYNEYIDGQTGEVTTWEELKEEGYKVPEAFRWQNSNDEPIIIPGYWLSKYQLSELGSSYKINYNLIASKTNFKVSGFTNTISDLAKTYTYAINGQVVNTSDTLEDYSFENTNSEGDNYINVTALDENGSIVGSMTKKFELTEANEPDLTGFDKDTTFYVYWDDDGNEHNEIPISQEPPAEWYNYSYAQWANIVSRNNGLESYFVWIPRYQYSLDSTSQRSDIQFIIGNGTETKTGYKIPEAFTWGDGDNNVELTGYWMSKYQFTMEEATERITAEMSAKDTLIRIGDITGTLITDAKNNNTNLKIEYYLNENKVHEGTETDEHYVYENLTLNTEYTINIILRNSDSNEYIGAITKKVKTAEAYAPDLTGFDKETTYYVIYDNDGNETERISIKEDMPDSWYDYSDKKWANIVTTANDTETYFVWIPRYEYRIEKDRANLSLTNRRTDVHFITTDITNSNTTTGYIVPEAFTWGDGDNNVELTGYWMSKYQLNQK